jgi:hypothetical protein
MVTKTRRIERNRRISAKNPKIEPLFSQFGREINRKEPRRVHAYIPQQIIERKDLKLLQEKCQEKARNSPKMENREELKQGLRNHAESFIHTMKVHTRSSFRLIILPSHKISS